MVHRTPFKNLTPPVPPARLEPGRAALLLLDMQAAALDRSLGFGAEAEVRGIPAELDEYFEQCGYAARNAADLLAACRARGPAVLHSRLAGDPATAPVGQAAFCGRLFPPGDPAAAIPPALAPLGGEPLLDRTALDAFVGTDLAARLRDIGAEWLVVAGVGVGGTVEQTARHAADLGFGVVVVSDASPDETYEIHGFRMRQLVGGLIRVRTTEQVLEMLAGERT